MLSLRWRDTYTTATNITNEFESIIAQFKALWLAEHNEDGTHRSEARDLAFIPVGSLMDWPTATPPSGWLICNGAQVSRVTYFDLFQVIGTTFGVGDGSTTFNLPDARGRFSLSKAAAGTGSSIAATGGSLDHTHLQSAHTHAAGTLAGPSHTHGPGTLSTGAPSTTDTTVRADPPTADVEFGLHNHTHSVTGGVTAADGTGAVTGSTASGGSGSTAAENPAFIVLGNKVIYSGVA